MSKSHTTSTWYSETGFIVKPLSAAGHYMLYNSSTGDLEIGAGEAAGTNVALKIDASGNVTITNLESDGVISSGLIRQNVETSSMEITGSDTAAEGGNLIAYGSSHATLANDWILRSGSTAVVDWDDSADELTVGKSTGSDVIANITGKALRLSAGATNEALLRLANNDGSIRVTGGSNASNGAAMLLYGGTHSTLAQDIALYDATINVLYWDKSDQELELVQAGDNVLVQGSLEIDEALNHDGTTVGFYGTAPATQPTAYTQTYSTATKTHSNPTGASLTDSSGGTADQTIAACSGTGDDTNVNNNFAECADEINKLVTDLANTKQVLNQVIDDLQTTGLLQ